jgi:hypothetical protein
MLSLLYNHRCFHGIWWLISEAIHFASLFCCDFLTSARLHSALRTDLYGAFPTTEPDYGTMSRYPSALTLADYIQQDMWRHVANARMATRLRASLIGLCSLWPTVLKFGVWIVALQLLRLSDIISETTRILAFENVSRTLVVGTWTPSIMRLRPEIRKYALLYTATVLGTGLHSMKRIDEGFYSREDPPHLPDYSASTLKIHMFAICYLSYQPLWLLCIYCSYGILHD